MFFGSPQPHSQEITWRRQLDQFAKANQQELAALSWGLWLENGDNQGMLGINLKPQPHFVYCPKSAIKTLNDNVENQIQEILGIVDNYQPEKEVLIIGIGSEQIKLIHYEPEPAPPICYAQLATDVNTLLERLEQHLSEQIS
ncbi:beta-carboxysome assembly chaperone CcmS [Gloeocapsopsis dulcis]|uniref:Chaperone protein CcmS domain-containing protein n=1 Tax=Gloeocapsopsis dulcis AAB1 = 1H9 TaxID=1433147 RepID=A0A6N8FPL2_9CHRO|nr:hypothetical protein [Gloeocapsopsis dulcis]MUL35268.1 hypothetical protein [Gloeocapsopsis dulcis AAB1 = 1H9]WNN89150.1 hypothetical protein P0S91_23350 [Gloeocapsopsis dulcis]